MVPGPSYSLRHSCQCLGLVIGVDQGAGSCHDECGDILVSPRCPEDLLQDVSPCPRALYQLCQVKRTPYLPQMRPGHDDVVGCVGRVPADGVATVGEPHTGSQIGGRGGPLVAERIGDLGQGLGVGAGGLPQPLVAHGVGRQAG